MVEKRFEENESGDLSLSEEEQRESLLRDLAQSPLRTLRQLAHLVDISQRLALSWGDEPVNWSVVTADNAARVASEKIFSTEIDWYSDGSIVVRKALRGSQQLPLIDMQTVEGLAVYVWNAYIGEAISKKKVGGSESIRDITISTSVYQDSIARSAFELLCLNGCGKHKSRSSDYCSDSCRDAFWKWCRDQAKTSDLMRSQNIQKKMNKFRENLVSMT